VIRGDLPDQNVRAAMLREGIETVAAGSGGRAVVPDATFAEVVNLVEWPTVAAGSFDREFLEVPRELLGYLVEEREPQPDDPPFMHELAHYEWVELALAIDEQDVAAISADPAGDLLAGVPVLSPLAWPLAYRFPVHRLGPRFQPEQAPADPSFYVARRDRRDQVGFLHVSAVTLRLVERLQQNPYLSGAAHLNELANALPQLDPRLVSAGGAAALQELRRADVVLGSRPE
jgi:hypothetical protein